MSYGWYQKPTVIGTNLIFRSCAPLQNKKSVNEGILHRVFRSTTTWERLNEAMKINRKQWSDNQYPDQTTSIQCELKSKVVEAQQGEINKTRTDAKNILSKVDKARGVVHRGVNEKLPSLVVGYRTLRRKKTTTAIKETHQKKLEKLAERQD